MGPQSHLHTPLSPRLPQLRLSCALPDTPSLPKVACNSQTGVTQRHEVMRTGNISRGNCMRNCRTAPVYARPEDGAWPAGLAAVPVGDGRARASARAPSPARLEAAAGPAGPGRGAGGWWRGLAGQRADAPSQPSAHRAPLVWWAPEGPEGTGGLRGAAPNEVRP